MARIAGFRPRNRNLGFLAEYSLLELDRHRILQIVSALRRVRIAPAAASAKEHIEYIAEAAAEIGAASAHALVASPFKSAYVAAKHGLAGLTKVVALETAEAGITVNAICPGYVWTPLVEKQIPDTMKARHLTEEQVKRDVMLYAQPTKQFVTIDQVAALAVYLCSDAASQITGALLPIDGGWTAA